jgi:hypothetical protein
MATPSHALCQLPQPFREEYEGATLRENMGLERPKTRYAS